MAGKLIFIYNADSGLFNTVTDIAHKIFSPETYSCNLCALTHDYFTVRDERFATEVEGFQLAADAAARRTLLAYDRRHGYRGAAARLDAAVLGDPEAVADALRGYPSRGGLAVGVVASVQDRTAIVQRRDGVAIELGWDDLSWARPALPDDVLGPAPKSAGDVVAPGDVVDVSYGNLGQIQLSVSE